jgi:hypothetical protein
VDQYLEMMYFSSAYWQDIALTVSPNATYFYVNLQKISSIAIEPLNTTCLLFGMSCYNSQNPFFGYMDNLRIWNRALSSVSPKLM